jgi:GNAT superfamily N-acetyltransferase
MSASIRLATVDDRDSVVSAIVLAFQNDPAFRYMFPHDETYESLASLFVGYLFDKRVGRGRIWITTEGSVCTAAALWSPPGTDLRNDPVLTEMRRNMLHAVGDDAAVRIATYDQSVDAKFSSEEPYWYLGVLAAHPDYRGQGLAAAVMRAGVDAAHSHGCIAMLETATADNVPYYEQAGWNVVVHVSEHAPLPFWILKQ